MNVKFLALGLLFQLLCGYASLAAEVPIKHSFFIAGATFTGIIAEDGSEEWNAGRAGARDGFVLPNGHVLIAWANEVKELDRAGKVHFHYPSRKRTKKSGQSSGWPTATR